MTRRNSNAQAAKPAEDGAPQQPEATAEEPKAAEQPDPATEEAHRPEEDADPDAVARFVVRKGYIDKETHVETSAGDIVEISARRAAEINATLEDAVVAVKESA